MKHVFIILAFLTCNIYVDYAWGEIIVDTRGKLLKIKNKSSKISDMLTSDDFEVKIDSDNGTLKQNASRKN